MIDIMTFITDSMICIFDPMNFVIDPKPFSPISMPMILMGFVSTMVLLIVGCAISGGSQNYYYNKSYVSHDVETKFIEKLNSKITNLSLYFSMIGKVVSCGFVVLLLIYSILLIISSSSVSEMASAFLIGILTFFFLSFIGYMAYNKLSTFSNHIQIILKVCWFILFITSIIVIVFALIYLLNFYSLGLTF